MNQERLMKVLLGPHTSEKASIVADKYNQVVFKVALDASKQEVKQACEFLFKVKVLTVKTVKMKGKVRNFRQMAGQRNNWKKAYVTLAEGNDIDFIGTE